MRALLSASALALATALPTFAAAEVTVSSGFTLTSRFISSGTLASRGAAFQPWVEAESNGFYGGLWASNVDDGGPDRAELDVYFGYRNDVGMFSYDIGYARYLYNSTGDCCGEIILGVGIAPIEQFGIGASVAYDPSAESYNAALAVDFAVTDRIGLAATYGRVESSHNYWSVGANYALTDNSSLDLTWHDTNVGGGGLGGLTDGIAVLSYSMDFTLFSR